MRINHFLTRSFHFSLLEGLPRLLPSHELQPYFEDEFFFYYFLKIFKCKRYNGIEICWTDGV